LRTGGIQAKNKGYRPRKAGKSIYTVKTYKQCELEGIEGKNRFRKHKDKKIE
jgi:hypothetical protein